MKDKRQKKKKKTCQMTKYRMKKSNSDRKIKK